MIYQANLSDQYIMLIAITLKKDKKKHKSMTTA